VQTVLLYVPNPRHVFNPGLLYVHAVCLPLVLPSFTIGGHVGIGQRASPSDRLCGVGWICLLSTVLPDSDVGIGRPDTEYALLYGATCVAVILLQYTTAGHWPRG